MLSYNLQMMSRYSVYSMNPIEVSYLAPFFVRRNEISVGLRMGAARIRTIQLHPSQFLVLNFSSYESMFLSVSEELSSKLPGFSSVSVHPPVSCELRSPHGLLRRLAHLSHSLSPHWPDAHSICCPCRPQLLPQKSMKKCAMPSFTPG